MRHVALAARDEASLAAAPGGFASRKRGRGLEIADVREYQTGDDLRQLDRGTTARTGRLHVRLFQEERDRIVLLVADFRSCMFWGVARAFRSVAAAEALALIGWTVVAEGGRVGLLALTDGAPVMVPSRGRTRGMLDAIGGMVAAHRDGLGRAGRGPSADPPLDAALSRLERIAPAGSEIVIASGFDRAGPAFADRLGQAARRRSVRLLAVSAGRGGELPPGTYPIRLPDGRVMRLRLGRGSAPEEERIDGWPATRIESADPPEETARRLALALQAEPAR
nr:DUF58 domain-containing protein [Mangrovicoccus sp. HB161399]